MSSGLDAIRYFAGGTIPPDYTYVERAADAELLRLCRAGAFTYVLTSRQMGKSSLMVRTAEKLRESGVHAVIVDLTLMGRADETQWYRGILDQILSYLGLRTPVDTWWDQHEHLSNAQRFSLFLINIVLKEIAGRIVIFVDEIDFTLEFDFTDAFFASIRYLHNLRAENPRLKDLSFVLLGAASPGDLVKNPDLTPFNIGEPVDLQDFTETEAATLHHDLELVRSVLRYTSGQPYLTVRLFRSIQEEPSRGDVKSHVESVFYGDQAREDSNLRFVQEKLLQEGLLKKARNKNAVLNLYRDVLRGNKVRDKKSDPVCVRLRFSGIVRNRNGVLQVTNLIYKTVFDQSWIQSNKQVDWPKRAAQAAGVTAMLVLGFLIGGYLWVNHQNRRAAEEEARKARHAEETARQETAVAERQSRLLQESNRLTEQQKKDLEKQKDQISHSEQAARQARDISEKNAAEAQKQTRIATADKVRLDQEAQRAEQAEANATRRAEETKEQAEKTMIQSLISQSLLLQQTHPDPDQVRIAMLLAIESSTRSHSLEPLGILTNLNNRLLLRKAASIGQGAMTNSVALSPNGRLAATASRDGTAVVFEGQAWRQVRRFSPGSNIESVALSRDEDRLATAGDDGVVRIFDIDTGREVTHLDRLGRVLSVALSSDGLLATGSEDQTARIFELASRQTLIRLPHAGRVRSVAFSPNAPLLATGSDDGTLRVFEAGTAKPVKRDVGHLLAHIAHGYPINSVAFSEDGSLLAAACEDGAVRVFDTNWREVARLSNGVPVRSVSFGARDQFLATGNGDGTARIFDTLTWQEVARIREEPLRSVALSSDGRWLVTSDDKTAQVFEIRPQRANLGESLAFGRTGDLEAVRTFENTVHILDSVPGAEDLCMHCPVGLNSVAFSPNKHLVAVGEDKAARVFDVESRQQIARFAHSGPVRSVAFSPDGHFLAIGSDDKTGSLVETNTWREVARFPHDGPVRAVAFSQDGTMLATGAEDKSARVFNVKSRRQVSHFPHSSPVLSVAFAPDGRWLATASQDSPPRLFDLRSQRERSIPLKTPAARYVSFSPDSQFLATAAVDNTVRVLKIESGNELARLPHVESIRSLAFSPDDQIAAVGYSFVDIGHWRPEDIIKDACDRLSFNLSHQEWDTYLPGQPYSPTCPGLPEPLDPPRLAAEEK